MFFMTAVNAISVVSIIRDNGRFALWACGIQAALYSVALCATIIKS